MRITLDRYPNGAKKALTMSYDDGTSNDRRLAGIFDKYGVKGTFHLNSALLGDGGHITAEEIPELFKNHEVSCHTLTHPFPTLTPREQLLEEIIRDRMNLEDACGYPVRGMSYPYGASEADSIKTFRAAGMEYSRTTYATNGFSIPADFMLWHPTCHHNGGIIEKSDAFISLQRASTLMLFYVWGHSYEFPAKDNWQLIEDFCAKMGGRDDIWYATNIQICDYVSALKALRFSAKSDKVYNPSAIKVAFSYGGEVVYVNAGETKAL